MSKKKAHGPIPSGNKPKHGIGSQPPAPEEEDELVTEPTDDSQAVVAVDDVADEKGHIRPAVFKTDKPIS